MVCHLIKAQLSIIIILTTLVSFAQKDFQGQAYYESKTTVDMSNFGGGQLSEERKKQIAERMRNNLEKSFVLTFNQTESIYKEEEKLEAPGQGGGGRFGMMMSSLIGGDQYKNVKDKLFLQEQDLFGKQFLVKDSLEVLEWQLGSETRTIGQYTCFKATAVREVPDIGFGRFGRRPENEQAKDSTATNPDAREQDDIPLKEVVVTAWYTPQIPVNQGPDKYWGLPGLILEVNIDRTTILCSKIVLNPSEKENLKVPSKGKEITQADYDILVKEKTEEMRANFRNRGGRDGRRR